MSDERCGTCRFWKTEEWLDAPWGACSGIPDQQSGPTVAYTWDYEGYSSGLRTTAEFGCRLWSESESYASSMSSLRGGDPQAQS